MRFHAAEEGGYWGESIPPLRGVYTQGDTLEEARAHAREAVTLMLEGLLDDNAPIPRPPAAGELAVGVDWIVPEPEVLTPILLRWAREDARLTQGELATRLGVTYQAVQKLERSGANPSIKTLAKVARALGRELRLAL
jgi:predicted RNase H-like HicB family nuclease/DNA-binding XRE family transcriptional regulator